MVTRNGTVKRTEEIRLRNMPGGGPPGASPWTRGDELIAVLETDGEANVLIATHDGMAIWLPGDRCPAHGPDCGGGPGH